MVMWEIVQDWETLGEMSEQGELVLSDGTVITFEVRFDKNDAPMLAHKGGVSPAGTAAQKCCSAAPFVVISAQASAWGAHAHARGQDTGARG